MSNSKESSKDNNGIDWNLLNFKNLRDITILIFFAVLSFKLFGMQLTLDIKEFGFTDLLSMIVAFFAISLSVVFYFKATDTSNRFYDNSYAFTKDVSEILGRMEAGFGERLKHLDEGYSGIRDKFDRMPFDSTKLMKDIEKEKKEINEKEAEQHKMLEDLAKRAKLAESEKTDLFEHMHTLSKELEEARSEAARLEDQVRKSKSRGNTQAYMVLSYVFKLILEEFGPDINMQSARFSFRQSFRKVRDSMPNQVIKDMVYIGLIDDDFELTKYAVDELRELYKKST